MTKRESKYHHSMFKYLIKKIMLQDKYWDNSQHKEENSLGVDPFSKPNGRMVNINSATHTLKKLNKEERKYYLEQLAEQPRLAKEAAEMGKRVKEVTKGVLYIVPDDFWDN